MRSEEPALSDALPSDESRTGSARASAFFALQESRPAHVSIDEKRLSLSPVIHDVHEQRKNDAQEDAGHQRKVKRTVLAAIKNIAGQPAQWKMSATEDDQQGPDDDQHCAEKDQNFTKVAHSLSFQFRISSFKSARVEFQF